MLGLIYMKVKLIKVDTNEFEGRTFESFIQGMFLSGNQIKIYDSHFFNLKPFEGKIIDCIIGIYYTQILLKSQNNDPKVIWGKLLRQFDYSVDYPDLYSKLMQRLGYVYGLEAEDGIFDITDSIVDQLNLKEGEMIGIKVGRFDLMDWKPLLERQESEAQKRGFLFKEIEKSRPSTKKTERYPYPEGRRPGKKKTPEEIRKEFPQLTNLDPTERWRFHKALFPEFVPGDEPASEYYEYLRKYGLSPWEKENEPLMFPIYERTWQFHYEMEDDYFSRDIGDALRLELDFFAFFEFLRAVVDTVGNDLDCFVKGAKMETYAIRSMLIDWICYWRKQLGVPEMKSLC